MDKDITLKNYLVKRVTEEFEKRNMTTFDISFDWYNDRMYVNCYEPEYEFVDVENSSGLLPFMEDWEMQLLRDVLEREIRAKVDKVERPNGHICKFVCSIYQIKLTEVEEFYAMYPTPQAAFESRVVHPGDPMPGFDI